MREKFPHKFKILNCPFWPANGRSFLNAIRISNNVFGIISEKISEYFKKSKSQQEKNFCLRCIFFSSFWYFSMIIDKRSSIKIDWFKRKGSGNMVEDEIGSLLIETWSEKFSSVKSKVSTGNSPSNINIVLRYIIFTCTQVYPGKYILISVWNDTLNIDKKYISI